MAPDVTARRKPKAEKNRVVPIRSRGDWLRESCSTRWSVLSSNLLHVQELQKLTENAISREIRRSRKAFAKASATRPSGNAELRRGLDYASALSHSVISRPALFVMAYGLHEFELDAICRTAFHAIPNALSPKEVRGNSTLEQTKLYLGKVVGLDLSPMTQEWTTLRNYCVVRNVLIHVRGYLADDREQAKRVREFAKGNKALTISAMTGRVELNESFLQGFTVSLAGFWRQLEIAWRVRWATQE